MNWVLIIVFGFISHTGHISYTKNPHAETIRGFSKEGCIATAKSIEVDERIISKVMCIEVK